MKKFYIYLCMAVIFPTLQLHAQISTLVAEKYDIGIVAKVNKAGYMPPGTMGSNQIWDFTTLSVNDSIKMLYFGNMAGSPFPDASVVRVIDNGAGNVYTFYKHDTTGVIQLGILDSTSNPPDTIKSTNNKLIMKLPFTYNNSFTDTFDVDGGVAGVASGIISGRSESFGELRLPDQTYSNTIRVHITDSMTGTLSGNSVTVIRSSYVWYSNDKSTPLLKLDSTATTTATGTIVTQAAYYLVSESLHIGNKELMDLSFKGSISGNKIILYNMPQNDHQYELSLINISGQAIYNTIISGKQHYSLNTGVDITPGIYVLVLEDLNSPRSAGALKLHKQ